MKNSNNDKKIDIVIVGAQKAGTSSLNNYLANHPDFITHGNLEFGYFISEEVHQKGFPFSFEEHFPHYSEGKKLIAKSVGIMYMEEALLRLQAHNPDVKIVVALRNPVDRAYSAYWYARRVGWEKDDSFERSIFKAEAHEQHWLANRTCEYLNRSSYVLHLRQILRYFDKNQVYTVMAEDLRKNTETTCNDIMLSFGYSPEVKLGDDINYYNRSALPRYSIVSTILSDKNPIKKHLKSIMPLALGRRIKRKVKSLNEKDFTPPPMMDETRSRLVEYFRPYNSELQNLINKDVSHWNV